MTRIRLVLKGLPLSSRLVTYSGTKPIQMRAIVLTTTLCVAVGVLAHDRAKVDPEHVKVVAENDQVRVLRYHYGLMKSPHSTVIPTTRLTWL
jgi:hypothetical protein